MRLQSPFHPIREDGRRNRRKKKNKSVYKQNPNTRGRGLRKELMQNDTKLIPVIHLHKTKETAIRKTTYLPRKSVEKGVKELRRNKTHIL